ncbi:hypothetical protein LO772_32085 [Yinghuangia sp. ASG 101]|uniref:hypothetical protein n=1 Tax=Yinghuangia sp. ASG 101 TaxID=2896848 RepID=UPI001E5CC50F|nr:hypothetical protein [Yinghuangia sp. ASG 101]UGQ11382.1 hypothetical protein LO772_32085 [Yinghuangia sp. ASG 101]
MLNQLQLLAYRALAALPADDSKPLCSGGEAGECHDPHEPLKPTSQVKLPTDLRSGIESFMAYVQIGAWVAVFVAVVGVGVVVVWGWASGKGVQAAGRLGVVFGGAVIIATANTLVTLFVGFGHS